MTLATLTVGRATHKSLNVRAGTQENGMLQWKVTATSQMGYGPARSFGHGFSVQNESRGEAFTFVFSTEAEAKEVEEAMRKVVELAKDISIAHPGR